MTYQFQHKKTGKIIERTMAVADYKVPAGYQRVYGCMLLTGPGGKVKKMHRQKCDYVSPEDDSKPYQRVF